MIPLASRRFLALAILLGSSAWPVTTCAADTAIAGRIQYVHGPVSFKASRGALIIEALTPRNSMGRTLAYQNMIHCDKGGVVSVRRPTGGPFVLSGPSAWTPLPHVLSAVPSKAKIAMDKYARTGGIERGGRAKLFSPAPLSVIIPGDLTFCWTPHSDLQTLSLTLRSLDGHTIWRQEGIDASAGALTSEPARSAICTAAAKGVVAVVLTLSDQTGRVEKFRFGLMSPTEQISLIHDLNTWDSQTQLARHLGRAAVFTHYGMDNAAATEYDTALTLLPDDLDLVRQDTDAQKKIGNIHRQEELEQKLHAPT